MSDAYDPNSDEVTPALEELLKMAVHDALFDVATGMPGIVDSFDAATETISVQPALKRNYGDGSPSVAMPILQGVPVMWPSSAKSRITFPLAKGDPVWLAFSHRSLEVWKQKSGLVDPGDPRRFHLSDAVAFPGTRSPAAPTGRVSSSALRIEYGQTVLELQDGKMLLKGAGDELLDLVIKITTQLSLVADTLGKTTTNTMLGPQPLKDAPLFVQAKADIDALKAKVTAIKG